MQPNIWVHPQSVCLTNKKGGTGKTTIAANVGGLAAAAGYRVLMVDLDPQGNLGRDLGYLAAGKSDNGRSLLAAVVGGATPEPLKDIRPNLDVICGGSQLEDLSLYLNSRAMRQNDGDAPAGLIRDALAPLAAQYNMLIVDSPPLDRRLQIEALSATRYAVISTKADDGSLDGLAGIADLFGEVRGRSNPYLELLGVALFDVGSRSEQIRRKARDKISRDLGDADVMFDDVIRHLEQAAIDCRELGLLVHELEASKSPKILAKLRKRGDADDEKGVSGLAGDFVRLTESITTRITERSTAA